MTRRVDKPWGYEEVWAECPHYVGKILHINAGFRLSRQYHVKKEETFRVLKGEMMLELHQGEDLICFIMKEGDVYHCPPLTVHRMCATLDVDVLEVSTNHLDDVVRIEDDY